MKLPIIIWTDGLSVNYIQTLRRELALYNVEDVSYVARIDSTSLKDCLLVSGLDAAYIRLREWLPNQKNLYACSFLSGSNENATKWLLASFPKDMPKFLSHSLKEVRRSIVWFAAGGTFSPDGTAIPPNNNHQDLSNTSHNDQIIRSDRTDHWQDRSNLVNEKHRLTNHSTNNPTNRMTMVYSTDKSNLLSLTENSNIVSSTDNSNVVSSSDNLNIVDRSTDNSTLSNTYNPKPAIIVHNPNLIKLIRSWHWTYLLERPVIFDLAGL